MGKKRGAKKPVKAVSPSTEHSPPPAESSPPPSPVATSPPSPEKPSPTATITLSELNAPPPFLRRSRRHSERAEITAPSVSKRRQTKPSLFVDLAVGAPVVPQSDSLPQTPATTPLLSPPHQTETACTIPSAKDVTTPPSSPVTVPAAGITPPAH
ncbi:hypothetical protein C2S51_012520 [Perilla frutescens var. frutescens]|nr:hypothetical protein C2S51_012520 [Perilla frutescens var. frutescens]